MRGLRVLGFVVALACGIGEAHAEGVTKPTVPVVPKPVVPKPVAPMAPSSVPAKPAPQAAPVAALPKPAAAPAKPQKPAAKPQTPAPQPKPAAKPTAQSQGPAKAQSRVDPSRKPDPRGRRTVAGGPTFDEASLGAESPELGALHDAERELFPPRHAFARFILAVLGAKPNGWRRRSAATPREWRRAPSSERWAAS